MEEEWVNNESVMKMELNSPWRNRNAQHKHIFFFKNEYKILSPPAVKSISLYLFSHKKGSHSCSGERGMNPIYFFYRRVKAGLSLSKEAMTPPLFPLSASEAYRRKRLKAQPQWLEFDPQFAKWASAMPVRLPMVEKQFPPVGSVLLFHLLPLKKTENVFSSSRLTCSPISSALSWPEPLFNLLFFSSPAHRGWSFSIALLHTEEQPITALICSSGGTFRRGKWFDLFRGRSLARYRPTRFVAAAHVDAVAATAAGYLEAVGVHRLQTNWDGIFTGRRNLIVRFLICLSCPASNVPDASD